MQEVCIVIPCFNEERRLKGAEILAFLRAHENSAVCFVDDGSSDGTRALVDALQTSAPQMVRVLHLSVNSGKAEAVRQGVLHVAASNRFAMIGYWDADLSTPLHELAGMLEALAGRPSCGLAMGARVRRLGSDIRRSTVRHYCGRVFSTVASLLLRLPVYDSQCGAKVVRAELVETLFRERFLTRWVFDVEILARLRNYLGHRSVLDAVIEVPLTTWIEMGGSKLRLAHLAKVPFELLRISRHYNRRELQARVGAGIDGRVERSTAGRQLLPRLPERPVSTETTPHQ